MNYKGVIIEESLADKSFLKSLRILSTRIEPITEKHQTPWLKQWTLHTVEIKEADVDLVATQLSTALEKKKTWYTDFKNKYFHYIVFKNKVFKVDRRHPQEYGKVKKYGLSLGIPDYQLDFSPNIK